MSDAYIVPTREQMKSRLEVFRANLLSVCAMIQEHEDFLVGWYSTDDIHYRDFRSMNNNAWDMLNEVEEAINSK